MGDMGNLDVVDESSEGGDETANLGGVSDNSLQAVGNDDGFDLGNANVQVPDSHHNNGFDFDLGRVEKSLEKVCNEGVDLVKVESDKSSEVEGDEIGDGVDKKTVDFGSLIEEKMGKVSLGTEVSASSCSSSVEDDEVGPIRSKNEVQQDLPPFPPVNVILQPHHETLPVRVASSIIGSQVLVEGAEEHNPQSDDSIRWIRESRSPLEIVDDIFGPAKNLYYIVQYNTKSEVPSDQIQQGSLISYVPEFTDCVVNNNDLYKNGYDASGEDDEEVVEEAELSDDQKEAEHMEMQKMSKMGTDDKNSGNMKNDKKKLKNWSGEWKKDQNPSPSTRAPQDTIQRPFSQASSSRPQGPVRDFSGGRGLTWTFQPSPQPIYNSDHHRVWTNVTSFVHPRVSGMDFPYGVPGNMGPVQQNYMVPVQQNYPPPQHFQMPFLSGVPFPEQFYPPGEMMPPPPNLVFQGPVFTPWPTNMDQNVFYQPQFGPDFQSSYAPPPLNNVRQQEVLLHGSQVENSSDMRPPFTIIGGDNSGRQPFHGGSQPFRGGRRPFRGGSQPFRGGRQPFRGGRQPYRGGRYDGRFGGWRGGERQPNRRS